MLTRQRSGASKSSSTDAYSAVSRKRSAAAAALDVTPPAARQQRPIHFPPAALSDFVIHYQGAAFHVHTFVLCYHSSYFRAYIESLTAGERDSSDECDEHTDIAHCIRLPEQCGKRAASANDFKLFLCHLYFAARYSCVPFHPVAHINLSAKREPAVCLDSPSFTEWPQLRQAVSASVFSSRHLSMTVSTVSLCHYFDCAVLLSRCEGNILLALAENEHVKPYRSMARVFLFLASQFGLQRVKAACIPLQARSCRRVRNRPDSESKEQWEELMKRVDKDTLIELVQAICRLTK